VVGRRQVLLGRLPVPESSFLQEALRQETVGGALLLSAALVGMLWANSPWTDAYATVKGLTFGPAALHLDLTVEQWAADGLLAIFFFIAGLELKRELVCGTLRKPSAAALPIVAALSGMALPALVFLAVAHGDSSAVRGWAVPMATDIAFALAVLAVVGSQLPPSLRAFLLTLAIVDDMGAITIIAVFYTDRLALGSLAAAVALAVLYAVLQRRRVRSPWVYVPLALAFWTLVHATVAGVVLGLLTRVRPDDDEQHSPAERLEHRLRPLSAGFAVPVFALFAAGVSLSGDAMSGLTADVAAVGVVAGLVLGKFVGVLGGTWLTARLTRAELIAELAFGDAHGRLGHVKLAVLIASLTASALAAVQLRRRNRFHRAVAPAGPPG
jgi:NhaA family Na+:H+ antiporter